MRKIMVWLAVIVGCLVISGSILTIGPTVSKKTSDTNTGKRYKMPENKRKTETSLKLSITNNDKKNIPVKISVDKRVCK